jgi:hypothetical protein
MIHETGATNPILRKMMQQATTLEQAATTPLRGFSVKAPLSRRR